MKALEMLAEKTENITFDAFAFRQALDHQDYTSCLQVFQKALENTRRTLMTALEQGHDIRLLMKQWTAYIDKLLIYLWDWHMPQKPVLALLAVGGFGRGELHPYSDIDLLLLHNGLPEKPMEIQKFLQILWDIGLEVGHSVRSLEDCLEASTDLTVATNLLEARFLCGSACLYARFSEQKPSHHAFHNRSFYESKCAEKKARYKKFGHSAYRLEPNLKQSPGGLRDIHTLEWLNRFIFNEKTLENLVEKGWLTPEEWQQWQAAGQFFFELRWRLHCRSGRKEDRLSFDHQTALAEAFGYQGLNANAKVEGLMQCYYRHIHHVRYCTDLLWRSFYFYLFPFSTTVLANDENFLQVGNFLDFRQEERLLHRPELIFQAFIHLGENNALEGLTAAAIRAMAAHRHLLQPTSDKRVQLYPYFRRLLQGKRLANMLFCLHRYQVLDSYLPAFAAVTGQMQYDLFHIYTVDEHTLRVMREAVLLVEGESEKDSPLSYIAQNLPHPDWLYLAALFHDLGKGRGGAHSKLSAEDAQKFLEEHQYAKEAQTLVTWLIQEHLLFSLTAQKTDLEDPNAIAAFAKCVQSLERLDYLYVLTTADIRGTNPELWTNWKAALLHSLYQKTRNLLLYAEVTSEITPLAFVPTLKASPLSANALQAQWHCHEDDYSQRYNPNQLAWHSTLFTAKTLPAVAVRSEEASPAGEIAIFSEGFQGFFATVAAKLEKLQLNIVEAHFHKRSDEKLLAIFSVLEINGQKPQGHFREQELQQGLIQAIQKPNLAPSPSRLSAQLRNFPLPLHLEWQLYQTYSCLTLRFADYPGLLARIAKVFAAFPKLQLQKARITTLGQQVLDIFWFYEKEAAARPTQEISNKTEEHAENSNKKALIPTIDRPLSPELQQAVEDALKKVLADLGP